MANNCVDPFDDCFTGDELRELELVATQAESKRFQPPQSDSLKHLQTTISAETEIKNELSNKKSFHNEMQNMAKIINEKSGEIRLLRDKVRDVERLLNSERQAKMAEEKRRRDEKSQHEIELEKKVEVFQDRLEFKDNELQEAYQMIQNLKTKLSDHSSLKLTQVQPMLKVAFEDDCEGLSPKKPKLVKPENPSVFVNKLALSRNSMISNTKEIVKINAPANSLMNSAKSWCLSEFAWPDKTLISESQQAAFYRLLTYGSVFMNLHSAIPKLLQAQAPSPSTLKDATMVASFAMCSLSTQLSRNSTWHKRVFGHCFCPTPKSSTSNTIIDCLQVLACVLQSFEGLGRRFLVEDVISLLYHYHSLSLQSHVFPVLEVLLEKSELGQISLFVPVIADMKFKCLDSSLFSFIQKCIPYSVLIEQFVRQNENDESPFKKICLLIERDSNIQALFIQDIMQLLVAMMGHCNAILTYHNSFHHIFHVITFIMFSLFEKQEQAKLLYKCCYALYMCISLFPACLVKRHKHEYLMVKINQFLDSQPKSRWAEEMKQLISHHGV